MEVTEQVSRVRAMGLTFPLPLEDPTIATPQSGGFTSDEELLEEVGIQVLTQEQTETISQSVVQAVGLTPHLSGRIQELTTKIPKDFAGTVLRSDVPRKWIHKRGPNGEGRIILKPYSKPKTAHPIRRTAGKYEAMVKIAQEWVKDGKM